MTKVCLLGDARSAHLCKWARYLKGANYDVYVLSLRGGSIEGVKVYELSSLPISKIGYLFTFPKIRKILGEINPDILHAFHASSYGFLGAVSGFRPLIISTWGSDVLVFPDKTPLHKWILKWSLGRADMITATSHFLQKEIERVVSGRKVELLPLGVDTELFKPSRQTSGRKFIVVTVRNLERIYGLEYLIDAFSNFSKDKSEVELNIIGDGSLRKCLVDRVSSLGITNKVRFLGYLSQEQVAKELAKADVFVIPSLSESFGVAALEAASCGVPVIASNVGGLPEAVLDDKTGFLVVPGNSSAIQDKLDLLFNDMNLRRELGNAGRVFVLSDYSWDLSGSKIEKLYKKLVTRYTG